jgi:hypothetical protein
MAPFKAPTDIKCNATNRSRFRLGLVSIAGAIPHTSKSDAGRWQRERLYAGVLSRIEPGWAVNDL